MCEKVKIESDRIELARYCEKHLRQKSNLPQSFIAASYDDLVHFLRREGKHVEDVFLEIFLEQMSNPLEDDK